MRKMLGQRRIVETAQAPLDRVDGLGGTCSEGGSLDAICTTLQPSPQPSNQVDITLSKPLDVVAGWYAATDVDTTQMASSAPFSSVQDNVVTSADGADYGLEIVSLPFSVTGIQIAAATAIKSTMG